MLHLIAAAVLCATPNRDVKLNGGVMAKAVDHVDVPMGTEVDVRLTIEPDGTMFGRASNASIVRSSGNAQLDRAAIDDAERSIYLPKVVDCTPVSSTYVFRARFDSHADYLVWYSSWDGYLDQMSQPRPTPEPTPYVRFCTPLQNLTDLEFAQKVSEREQAMRNELSRAKSASLPVSVSDADIVATVKTHAPSARTVRILVRGYQEFSRKPGESTSPNQSDAVEIRDSSKTTRLFAVAFSRDGKFVSLDPLVKEDLAQSYGFAREMAAFTLLNDLMGGDEPIARRGCVRAVTMLGLSSMPGVIGEITSAMMTEPPRDAAAEARALDAYHAFQTSRDARENPMTKQTLARLGDSPQITFVYRDRETEIGNQPEVDIVRLSSGGGRAYATLSLSSDGKASMDSPALCFVGDEHCASYYVWP